MADISVDADAEYGGLDPSIHDRVTYPSLRVKGAIRMPQLVEQTSRDFLVAFMLSGVDRGELPESAEKSTGIPSKQQDSGAPLDDECGASHSSRRGASRA